MKTILARQLDSYNQTSKWFPGESS